MFEKENIEAKYVIWDKETNWKQFDGAVIKSPWDFIYKHQKFIDWLQNIEKEVPIVLNSPKLVLWSIQKFIYLKYLQEQGVNIITTLFIENEITENEIESFISKEKVDYFIVKGGIGAGSIFCEKFKVEDIKKGLEHANNLLKEYPVLIQPFVENIKIGERSIFYIDKKLTLSVIKIPKEDEYRVQADYGGTRKLFNPSKEDINFSDDVISKIKDDFLYARVDYVIYKDKPALMELELDSPYLYSSIDSIILEKFVEATKRKIFVK